MAGTSHAARWVDGLGSFDLDDVGTPVGKLAYCSRTGAYARKVENREAGKWVGHIVGRVLPCLFESVERRPRRFVTLVQFEGRSVGPSRSLRSIESLVNPARQVMTVGKVGPEVRGRQGEKALERLEPLVRFYFGVGDETSFRQQRPDPS